jgi:hypothetical protein
MNDGTEGHIPLCRNTENTNLSKITIYQFTIYDVANDECRKSRRWATREAIEWLRGTVLEDTATQVDSSVVGAEIAGMTARGFEPRRRTGFQQQVTA